MPDAMAIPISVLDQSPIVSGASPREAIEATIALAKRADELGYARTGAPSIMGCRASPIRRRKCCSRG
jgi:hypothetical protein